MKRLTQADTRRPTQADVKRQRRGARIVKIPSQPAVAVMDAIKIREGSVPARSGRLFSEALGWPYIAPWSTFLEVFVSRASENTVFLEAAGLRR
ncbi:hypothetical protein ACFV1N_32570 [Streptosporangium canum]|uniref:hypothetical protein n=1 Tax=Streptosporangium canum TaxID=324952 RepID=UPI00368CA1F5